MYILYFVVGQIFKEKELTGYKLLVPESKEVFTVSLENMKKVQSEKTVNFMNAYYKDDAGILIGTLGSLTDYPSSYTNGALRDRVKKLAVVYEVLDSDTGKLTGYGVCDSYGMLINVNLNKFVALCSKYEPCNFTLETSNGHTKAKSLTGRNFYKVKMKSFEAIKGYNSKLGEDSSKDKKRCSEIKDSKQSNMLPTINVYSYNDIKTSEFANSAQEKLFKAYANMKKLSPYYHTILMTIKREATTSVGTMAVTEDTMYYNMEFISGLTVGEVTFILIHEISHMAMRHSARHGNKDNKLWNIACDLYINSIISRDFGCYFGTGEKEVLTPSGNATIKVPDGGVHLSTINEVLDFGVDSPETIYLKLLQENKTKDGSSGKSSNSNSKDSSSDKDDSSESKENSSEESDNKSQDNNSDGSKSESDGSNKDSDGSDSQGGEGTDDSSTDEKQDESAGDGSDFDGSKSNSPSNSSLGEDGTEVDQKGDFEKPTKVSVVYNGKRIEGTISMDIITSEIGDSKDRNQRVNEKAMQTIQCMKTAIEIKEEKLGQSLVKNAGVGVGLLQRCIDFGLSTQVNWKVLLANMCKSNPKKSYTMGSPNEVYMNSGVTVAARRKIGKPTSIEGIKVCVDVSGSITPEELNKDLSEVNNIFRHYKVDGELIYWSTIVGNAGKFSDLKDMLKVNPISTGGTDVKCVFDYLAKKTRVNSKYEETQLKDISCVLIFTDGWFSTNYSEYAKYFGKKVIWVIPDSRFTFNPPFGKIALME